VRHVTVTHTFLQQVRRGTNVANPNAGKLADKLQEQNRKPTLPPESQKDDRLTVRAWVSCAFLPIGMKFDACAVGLERAMRADHILVLYSRLFRYHHVIFVSNLDLVWCIGTTFKSRRCFDPTCRLLNCSALTVNPIPYCPSFYLQLSQYKTWKKRRHRWRSITITPPHYQMQASNDYLSMRSKSRLIFVDYQFLNAGRVVIVDKGDTPPPKYGNHV
jgi:hypothetical protein